MEILLFRKTCLHKSYSLYYLNNLFVFSTSSDSVFCINCVIFVSQESRKNLNTFVNIGWSDWHNIIERQSTHVERKCHKDTIKDSHNLIHRFEKPEGNIDYHSDTVYRERCNKYPNFSEVIASSIHFHGRKGLALKGHK